MKISYLLSPFFFLSICLTAQNLPEFNLRKADVEMPLRLLASDELQGRNTGTVYIDIAARIIAEHYRYYGVQPLAEDYFQDFTLSRVVPGQSGTLKYKEDTVYKSGENMIFLSGTDYEGSVDVVFAGFGMVNPERNINDYEGLDVKDKLVIVLMGISDEDDPGRIRSSLLSKFNEAKERGAIGLLMIWDHGKFNWNRRMAYSMVPRIINPERESSSDDSFIFGEILPDQETFLRSLKEEKLLKNVAFSYKNEDRFIPIKCRNVIGLVEGTDPLLKNEYLVLSAHYDHVGIQNSQFIRDATAVDTIFNGARDDAMGTVALLNAARVFAEQPPRRSIILAAFTAEEKGLLGSQYYVDHPLVPLDQTVFNLNADVAGYNDTSIVTIFGYDEVQGIDLMETGSAPFGLQVKADPALDQNFFQRSDNFPFAEKGVPAPTFSTGFNAFDEELLKYLHRVTDNPGTINMDYLLKYSQAFIHTARIIANEERVPFWRAGSRYEGIGKELYKRK